MIGPYEVRGFLGQGGMGQVYRAFDPRLQRTVALKVIAAGIPGPTGSADSAENRKSDFSARLLREARAVAALSHPNVVAIYDVGESGDGLYFAMEYVVGNTLRNLLAKELPFSRKVQWLVDVARALDAAHRVGLIHRDVKPENVMVSDDGVVKMLDFGIARRTTGADQHVADTVTANGGIAGTPVYMSPEQIRGIKVDARCDQFGWGVLAYELLAGERPWPDTGDILSVVARVLTDEAPPLGDKVFLIPAEVEQTIHRALAKAVEQRFASMADVADALEPFATPSTGERIRVTPSTHSGEHPSAFAATTRVPTSLPLPPATPMERAVTDAPVPPVRTKRGLLALALPLVLLGALGAVTAVAWKSRTPSVGGGPRPLSTVPEAERAYKEGMALWHDGAEARSQEQLTKAIDLDPSFAAAYLEKAILIRLNDSAAAQDAYRHAFEHRHLLTERDNALLEASEPLVRAKPDVEEWLARLSGKVFQYPRDFELQYLLGKARDQLADDAAARDAFGNAVRLDPTFVPALAALARTERNLGHLSDAIRASETCVAVSPIASVCHEERYELFTDTGKCRLARDEADAWRTLEPKSPRAQAAFGRSLHADGAPLPSVEEGLGRAWALLPVEDRAQNEKRDRMLLAMVERDFAHAEELARAFEASLPPTADQDDHAGATGPRVDLLTELGRLQEAAKVSEEFLERMAGWPLYPFRPDPSMAFYEPLYRVGKLSRTQLEAKRTAWIEQERVRLRRLDRPDPAADWMAWVVAYGALVETREEAIVAVQRMPTAPLPMGSRRPLTLEFNLGKAYALAGRADAALPHLVHVTTTCPPLGQAMAIARAHYYLGMTYEAKGDLANAKTSFENVGAMWSGTKSASPSRTWKLARARRDALP